MNHTKGDATKGDANNVKGDNTKGDINNPKGDAYTTEGGAANKVTNNT